MDSDRDQNPMPSEDAGASGAQGPHDVSGPQPPVPGAGSWDLLEGPPEHPGAPGGQHPGAPGEQPPSPGERARAVPWSGRDVFVIIGLVVASLIFVFLLIQIVISVVVSLSPGFDTSSLADSDVIVALLLLIQWAVTLGVAFTYLVRKGYKLSPRVLGFRKTRPGMAALLLIGVLIADSIFSQVYASLVETLAGPNHLPSDVPSQNVTSLFGTSVIAIILTVVTVALLTPLIEETFFRGIVHRGLEQRYGFLPGATMSSAIFALAHVDYRLFVPIFALGFGFAYIVHKTGSIWPTIAGHFIINLVGVIAQFADPGS